MLAAWFDGARGHYEIQIYGALPPPWGAEYWRILETRYGVTVNRVAGCVVTEQLANYVEGYNAVSRQRIETHFGKDVFAECAESAENVRKAWKRERPKE